MLTGELPDPRELAERVDVEDRRSRAVGAENHVEAVGLDVAGEDIQRRVAVDDDAQTSGKQVLEMGDDRVIG